MSKKTKESESKRLQNQANAPAFLNCIAYFPQSFVTDSTLPISFF